MTTETQKTEKALAALDTMATIWAARIDLSGTVQIMLNVPAEHRQKKLIEFIKQAHVEGLFDGFHGAKSLQVPAGDARKADMSDAEYIDALEYEVRRLGTLLSTGDPAMPVIGSYEKSLVRQSDAHAALAAKNAVIARQSAVIDAAEEWWSERTPKDRQEGELMKALATLNGDWEGCEGCDHQCDEPCMPATVVQIHASIDAHLKKLDTKTQEGGAA